MTENIVAATIEKYRTAISEQNSRSTLFNLPKRSIRTLFLDGPAKAIELALASGNDLEVGTGILTPSPDDVSQFPLIASLDDQMIADHGLSSLYCGLGMIEWSDTSDAKSKMAPLVLVPVKVTAASPAGFRIRSCGDRILNEPLMKRLNLQRSAIPLEDPLSFIPKRSHVRIKAFSDRAAIGLFSTIRTTIAERLDEAFSGSFSAHPLVANLLATAPSAAALLPDSAADSVHPYLPCDTTQLAAIVAASSGQNLVIHGPPGTGKTQTITNIAAECLDQGKRVLILSEAVAALEPIVNRLGIRLDERATLNLCADASTSLRGNHGRLREVRDELTRLPSDARPKVVIATSAGYVSAVPPHWTFDTVIVDEASRMRLSYAIPAIAAARQMIIVGDRHQCGPSMIIQFSQDGSVTQESDMSIMEAAIASKIPEVHLTRHYRSKHPSLIEFSNERFYKRKLISAPSAHPYGEYGCIIRHVGGRTVAGANQIEADAIAASAVSQVNADSTSSIAVIAATFQQCVTIAKSIRSLDPKAYERIDIIHASGCQGIERDVVLLSLTFGPDERGAQKRNFGIFSDLDGHKVLNVCLTRARKRTEVFSSIEVRSLSPDVRTPNGTLGAFLRSRDELSESGDREVYHSQIVALLNLHGYEVASDDHNLLVKYEGQFYAAIQLTGAMSRLDETSEKAQLENSGWSVTSLPAEILNRDRFELDPTVDAVLKDIEFFRRKN